VAAVVALVTPGLAVAADRTGALDVAVGQRAAGARRDRSELRLLEQVALFVELQEEVLDDAVVVPGRGPGETVVREPEVLQVLDDHGVPAVGELPRRYGLAVGAIGDVRAMVVGAADREVV